MDKIYILAQELAEALMAEYEAKCAVADSQAKAAIVEVAVVQQATIDGKNADTRKAQRSAALAESTEYREALGNVAKTERVAAMEEIERRRVEAVVGLMKAWLYSQRE